MLVFEGKNVTLLINFTIYTKILFTDNVLQSLYFHYV
jgi:hypothetical protein